MVVKVPHVSKWKPCHSEHYCCCQAYSIKQQIIIFEKRGEFLLMSLLY